MCWNCRGAGNRDFLCEMKELLKEHRPSIMVLLEPRISGDIEDEVCRKLGKKRWLRLEAAGFSGGIWVMWEDEEIGVRLKKVNKFFLHLEVESMGWLGLGANCHLRQHPSVSVGKIGEN